VQNIENYLPIKIPRNAGHICFLDQIPERFSRHVRPLAQTCPGLTSSAAAKSLARLIRPLNYISERFAGDIRPLSRYVQAAPYLQVSQLIQLLTRVPESFPGHDRLLVLLKC
jgi:hypothetical protein